MPALLVGFDDPPGVFPWSGVELGFLHGEGKCNTLNEYDYHMNVGMEWIDVTLNSNWQTEMSLRQSLTISQMLAMLHKIQHKIHTVA